MESYLHWTNKTWPLGSSHQYHLVLRPDPIQGPRYVPYRPQNLILSSLHLRQPIVSCYLSLRLDSQLLLHRVELIHERLLFGLNLLPKLGWVPATATAIAAISAVPQTVATEALYYAPR
jgi:hypothetical protein